jgi:hypothetical protein
MSNLTVKRRLLATLLLLVGPGLAACRGGDEKGLRVTVLAGERLPRPEALTISWLSGDRAVFQDRRVPEDGALPAAGPLASILVTVDPSDPADRKLLVYGMSGAARSSVAAIRIAGVGGWSAVSLTLVDHLADADGDGIPDVIDDCPHDGDLCTGGDAGARPDSRGDAVRGDGAAPDLLPVDASKDTTPPDAGAPAGNPDAAPDTASPRDAAPPVDVAPSPDLAPPPDLAALVDTAPAVDPALVAWWRFEEGSGTAVADSSGQGNNGVIRHPTGADWTGGHPGTALACAGTNWLGTATSASYDRITTLTMAAWVLWNGPSATSAQTVIGRQTGPGFDNAFWLGLRDDIPRFVIDNLSVEALSTPMVIGRWTHLAGTFDGASLVLYVDGREAARISTTRTIPASTSGVTVGADLNGADPNVGDRFFRGRVDEALLYRRALSAAEIATLAR